MLPHINSSFMADLTHFDPNSIGNTNFNIFGLPSTEEEARLVIMPIPWEVTVSYRGGTARAPDRIFNASFQVDLFDAEFADEWRKGIFMRDINEKILTKSDYLRKEAELYINFISQGDDINDNKFMCKTLKDINAGSLFLNDWVYQQAKGLLDNGKLVALLGGDHSTPLGFIKALADQHNEFAVLQIDAHCDLRKCYEGFDYSHASIMYNVLEQVPQVKKLVQVGPRDYCQEEAEYINASNNRVKCFFDREIKEPLYEGATWKTITQAIVDQLPAHVYISFDVDGLDPKLCPCTGTPVYGGLELEQVFYLFKNIIASGRKIIGFDVNETGVSNNEWDENVAARILFKLSNMLLHCNAK